MTYGDLPESWWRGPAPGFCQPFAAHSGRAGLRSLGHRSRVAVIALVTSTVQRSALMRRRSSSSPTPPHRLSRLLAAALGVGLLMSGAVIASPREAEAQATRGPYRVGVLNEAWAANHPTVEGLKSGLKKLGLEEG